MQLIPEGRTGFLEQVSPSPPPSCQQLHPPWPLNKPGPFRMSPEGHRATLRAWKGHGCCRGLPTLVDNIPYEANLLQVKTIQSAPPGVHWEGSFGMSEARRLKGRPEVNNARGGTSTSCQGGRAAGELGGEEWCQGSQRGLSVASCNGCYIPQKRAAVLGEAEVEQRTRQKTKQRTTKDRYGGEHAGSALSPGQAGGTKGRVPHFHPWIRQGSGGGGVLASQFSFGFLYHETPRDMGFSPYSHQDRLHPDK
ncbi:uncharacterized protein LOC133041519 [Dama dama]|uniref:uncharacterized protein LOC133041519 n=1 Tax=Dama dama TaxID=30532 RepID=UPI002A36268A|nr:uncharacterized protein LOC133041519 [Dama dama]